jgi:predicted deacetylase
MALTMTKKRPSVISIHDVMPHTLANVERLLATVLADIHPSHIMLLVVPGLPWQPEQIEQLKQLQSKGYELAGHGWTHNVQKIQTIYHRLHSFFISRDAAEHLSKTEQELLAMLEQNLGWFKQHDFKSPKFYVPPAWAMGRISQSTLRELPFSCVETTRGFHDLRTGRRCLLPLVGFEADTRFRAAFLRVWNRLNCWLAKTLRPLRISIHPFDDEYLIRDQMHQLIQEAQTVHWSSVFESADSPKFDRSHNEAS